MTQAELIKTASYKPYTKNLALQELAKLRGSKAPFSKRRISLIPRDGENAQPENAEARSVVVLIIFVTSCPFRP